MGFCGIRGPLLLICDYVSNKDLTWSSKSVLQAKTRILCCHSCPTSATHCGFTRV